MKNAAKELETWDGVNKYITKEAKNALAETPQGVDKAVIDDKKDSQGKLSYTDIKDFSKDRQIQILKEFGLDDKKIKRLNKEEKRIRKILELQKK